MRRMIVVAALMLLVGACGGGSSPSSPSSPSTPTPPANRAPVVNSMTVNPTFGIPQLTSFAFSCSGSDPDGDALTYAWDFGDGTNGSGPAFSKSYASSGVATVRLTISDGKGATATDSRTVTVGSMTGQWSGTMAVSASSSAPMSLTLTQNGGVVTGTMVLAGYSGRTDPSQPGRIDSNGGVELRMKVNPFSDFTMRGTMDPSGRKVTGAVYGSGFNGESFTMSK